MDWMKMSRVQRERALALDGRASTLAKARASAFLRRAMGMGAGLGVIAGQYDEPSSPPPGPAGMTPLCLPLTGTAENGGAGGYEEKTPGRGDHAPAQCRAVRGGGPLREGKG